MEIDSIFEQAVSSLVGAAQPIGEVGAEAAEPAVSGITEKKGASVGATVAKAGQSEERFAGMPAQLQPRKVTQRLVSEELRALIVNYAASQLSAMDLSEVKWGPLAKRLGTQEQFLQEAAEYADGDSGELWIAVLHERIKRVGATRMFRDVTWEKLETRTLEFLHTMVDKGFVRDSGELLAIANTARKVNEPTQSGNGFGQGGNVNINIQQGDGFMAQDHLPSSGSRMTIDLSPRIASALGERAPIRSENRVIDGKMLTAKELRESMADFGNQVEGEVKDE